MAIESKRKDRVWVSYREAAAGTADTDEFMEVLSGEMDFPEPEWMRESDKMKLGANQFGSRAELMSVVTPFSIKCSRLSEVAYFMAFCHGTTDSVTTPEGGTNARIHEINPLVVTTRTLPTFTLEYGVSGTTKQYSGCVINDYSITIGLDGTGMIDATFNGWGNAHYDSSGTLTVNAAGAAATGENTFTSEPLIGGKATSLWLADSIGPGVENALSLSFDAEDMGANLIDLSTLYNSITWTYSNGGSPADAARGGGRGVVNDFTRKDPEITLEVGMRKDTATIGIDAALLADTQYALEIGFTGPEIESTFNYGLDVFFPKVQLVGAPTDSETPISRAVTFEVFEDDDNDAMLCFVQTTLTLGYNSEAV